MWSSSSTTKTFWPMSAVSTQLHHHPGRQPRVRPEAAICKGRPSVARTDPATRAGGGRSADARRPAPRRDRESLALAVGPQYEAERVAAEAEPLAQPVLQVAPVREVQQAGVVDEQHDRRRVGRGLRRVLEAEPLP